MSKPRFVLDTNLIVSAALLDQSPPRRAVELALTRGEVLMSDAVQLEMSEVLLRKKFDRYLPQEKRLRFLVGLLGLVTPVAVTEQIDVCRDPKDNKFLELAVSGAANTIVSGDADLLALHPFRGIPVLSAVDFIATFA